MKIQKISTQVLIEALLELIASIENLNHNTRLLTKAICGEEKREKEEVAILVDVATPSRIRTTKTFSIY